MRHSYQRFFAMGIFLAVLGFAMSPAALAQQKMPDATASITLTSLAFIGGLEWGKGTLDYKGKSYSFKVRGLEAGGVGLKRDSLHARVYYLNNVKDFEGIYAAAAASATIAGGGGVAIAKNQNGVELQLFSVTMGADFTLAAEGIRVKLDK